MLKNKKLWIAIGLVALALIFLITGYMNNVKQQQEAEEAEKRSQELLEQAHAGDADEGDSLIMQMQPDLVKSYGKLPEGYLWDVDGTLLSQGDPDMSAEDVVYAYLSGLKLLDMSSVQKYSRGSSVIDTYESYFDESKKNTDYTDSFLRNMYREALLSMQVNGIENSTVFAEDKQVFSVNITMLDLSAKDFWFGDKGEIYSNLKLYDADQSDSTKADIYLYDYILNYYKSDGAVLRDVTIDLTVQRYPDLDTGWLVSIDTDVDSACRYADGKLVVSYINEMYRKEGIDYLEMMNGDGFDD